MTKAPGFLGSVTESKSITATELATVEGLVHEFKLAEELIADKEAELKTAKQAFNRLSQEAIPNFLLQFGFEGLKLKGGREVTVKTDTSVSFPKNKEADFMKFLAERDDMDIVKTSFIISKLDKADRDKVFDFFADNDIDYGVTEGVHAQTKKKYFKELIAQEGKESLPEWMKVYDIRTTKIK